MATYDSKGVIVFPTVQSLVVFMAELKLSNKELFDMTYAMNVRVKDYIWEDVGYKLAILNIDVKGEVSKRWYELKCAELGDHSEKYGAMYKIYHQPVSEFDHELQCQHHAFDGELHIKKAYDNLGIQHEAGFDLHEYLVNIQSAMYHLICDTILVMEVMYDEYTVNGDALMPTVEDILTDS